MAYVGSHELITEEQFIYHQAHWNIVNWSQQDSNGLNYNNFVGQL
jgi:hypothetical protein